MNKSSSPLVSDQSPWNHNSNPIWLGSTISLYRNLEKFNFPGKLSTAKKKQIVSLLQRELLVTQQLKQAKMYKAEEMSPIEKEFFVEHFLSQHSFQQAHAGEAFVLDQTGEILIILNVKDHVHLHALDPTEELENTWNHLIKIESELSKVVNFAFSPKFGFLTSDPMQSGTGLNAAIFLHIPMLLHANRLEEILKKNKEESVEYTGIHGDPHDIIGDVVAFHNSYSLGVTEENILHSLRILAAKLIAEEKSLRQHFKEHSEVEQADIKDRVSRAFAILLHSYQIEAVEALHALSLLKVGLDLGWLNGITHEELNKLFFSCRRAHLLCHYGQKMIPEEIPHKRAEFIHLALQNLKLLI